MMLGFNRLWEAFRVGMAISAIPLRWYVTVTRWLNNMEIVGGRIERTPEKIIIYPNTDDGFLRTVAFGTTRGGGLGVVVQQGKVYFKGVSITISSWPTDGEVTVTDDSTLYGYVEVSLSSATATWGASASDPGDGDDDTEIWRIFKAVAEDGAITEIIECQHGDIHIPGNA
jgi:hypothetical protein